MLTYWKQVDTFLSDIKHYNNLCLLLTNEPLALYQADPSTSHCIGSERSKIIWSQPNLTLRKKLALNRWNTIHVWLALFRHTDLSSNPIYAYFKMSKVLERVCCWQQSKQCLSLHSLSSDSSCQILVLASWDANVIFSEAFIQLNLWIPDRA